MKLIIISNSYWNIYNFRRRFLNILKSELKCEIHILAPHDEFQDKLKSDDSFICHNIKISASGTNPLKDFILIPSFLNLFRNIKPDVILTYTIKPNIYASIAARRLSIPIINNISGLGTVFIKKTIITTIVSLLYRAALTKNNFIFFQNHYDLKIFQSKGLLNRSKFSMVPGSGVDTQKFKPNSININKGKRYLFIGRLLRDKGIIEFIIAAKEVKEKFPELTFSIVGQLGVKNNTAISKGILDKYIHANIISYLGPSDNIKQIISEHDVIVLPSYREGMSKALLEAASMSKPIITTNVPGCKEIVCDGINGLLCKARSSEDLALKIINMYKLSESQRLLMGKEGRKKMLNQFDESIVIEKYLNEINNLLTK